VQPELSASATKWLVVPQVVLLLGGPVGPALALPRHDQVGTKERHNYQEEDEAKKGMKSNKDETDSRARDED